MCCTARAEPFTEQTHLLHTLRLELSFLRPGVHSLHSVAHLLGSCVLYS